MGLEEQIDSARQAVLDAVAGAGAEEWQDFLSTRGRLLAEASQAAVRSAAIEQAREDLLESEPGLELLADQLSASELRPLGQAAREAGAEVAAVRRAADAARDLDRAEAELAELRRDRSILARARTKLRRRSLTDRIEGLRRAASEGDEALGRELVKTGLAGLAAPLSGLPAPAVARLQEHANLLEGSREDLDLPALERALDLRPALSRAEAERRGLLEAADGAATQALQDLADRRREGKPLPEGVAELLDALHDLEHGLQERQRLQLNAQLEAMGDEEL